MEAVTTQLQNPSRSQPVGSLKEAIIRGRADALYNYKGQTSSILEAIQRTITQKLAPFVNNPETERVAKQIMRTLITEEP